MRILLLAPQPFFVERGTPIAVYNLTRALSDDGHHIDLLVFPGGRDIDLPNVSVTRLPALPGLSGIRPGFSARKILADLVLAPMAAARMARQHYDLVIAVEEAAYIALALKKIFRVPYIFDVDSSIPEQMDDKFGLPRRLFLILEGVERYAAQGAVGAITCCRALEDTIRSYAPALPIQTLEDIPLTNGPPSGPAPEDCRYDQPIIMYVGNLEPYQGVDLLIDGFAIASSEGVAGRLVIIGGRSDQIAALKVRAASLGVADNVSLLGPRPIDDIGAYLAQATVVASPRTQGRNTPMKIYTYLDSERPLIATRLPTHTQVLDDEIAMLVEPNPKDMARGIHALLSDDALRARLAQAARTRVSEEFSFDAFRRKLRTFMTREISHRIARTARRDAA